MDTILGELTRITKETSSALRRGGSALDAVERAVCLMEDSGHFNAGLGSCLTSEGKAELEAGICRGSDQATGSVFRVTNYLHPISMARFVMEKTDMVAVHGDSALELMHPRGSKARSKLVTPKKLELWKALLSNVAKKDSHVGAFHPRTLRTILRSPAYRAVRKIGTVGAVALDESGELAAANSTGGFWLKLPGRIGDSPFYGAGFYASSQGAAVATGVGEHMIRTHFCRSVVENMSSMTAQQAVRSSYEDLEALLGGNNAGVVAVDRRARIGVWHNTLGMCHAFHSSRLKAPVARPWVTQGKARAQS
jgi:beta-aspartyl-peptidase (threonine type)